MNEWTNYALRVGQIHKEGAVERYGIGEDIQPILFAWCGEEVAMVGSVAPHVAKRDRVGLFMLATMFARTRHGADALTVVFDGMFATSESEEPVPARFAQGDPTATEALLALHVPLGAAASMWALPYALKLGRVIEWSSAVLLDNAEAGGYVKAIRDAAEADDWYGDEHTLSLHGMEVT